MNFKILGVFFEIFVIEWNKNNLKYHLIEILGRSFDKEFNKPLEYNEKLLSIGLVFFNAKQYLQI